MANLQESAGVVIVGTGQGGFQTAASLRAEGYDGRITLIGEEVHLPYQRPPLSKAFLLGKQEKHQLTLRPESFYTANRIEVLAGERVESIDTPSARVHLASGGRLEFNSLVLATGAGNRLLPLTGADLDGVRYLRTLDESSEIRQRLANAQDVVVIGGGFIGLELAAAGAALGKQVTVVEALPRLMARVVSPVVSEFYRQIHESHGVQVLLNTGCARIHGYQAKVSAVELSDGRLLPATLVIVGIGVTPNTSLARDAGLDLGNGIAVNSELRSSDPRIFAIGDCAEFPSHGGGTRLRLESVQNCVDHAICVAQAVTGHGNAYSATPWFWSDQYDVRLQMAGLPFGFDQTAVRGNPASGKFSVFFFAGNRLLSVDSINRPADHLTARKLLASGIPLTPQQAADESFDLKALTSRPASSN